MRKLIVGEVGDPVFLVTVCVEDTVTGEVLVIRDGATKHMDSEARDAAAIMEHLLKWARDDVGTWELWWQAMDWAYAMR